jgi:L-ascorbate metabolism protein UlaG (beta-lactamase superfamily)
MIISYLGHSCFKIQDKVSDGVTVVTDPFSKNLGLKVPNFEADVVTVSHSHSDHSNSDALRGEPYLIDVPGEYEIKGAMVVGVESFHDNKEGSEHGANIIYRLEIDGIAIAHLGDLGHKLSDEELEKLGVIDILMVPVGGGDALDARGAVEVVNQIEPRIVIPMHYKTADSKAPVDGIEKFIKELGVEPKHEEKLKIAKKELPQEGMDLVILDIA